MHYVKTFYAKLRGASRKIPRASQLGHSDNSEKADWGCDPRKIVETEGGPANATHYSRKSICQRRSVWVGSQVVIRAGGAAAKVAGLPLEQVQGWAIGGRFCHPGGADRQTGRWSGEGRLDPRRGYPARHLPALLLCPDARRRGGAARADRLESSRRRFLDRSAMASRRNEGRP